MFSRTPSKSYFTKYHFINISLKRLYNVIGSFEWLIDLMIDWLIYYCSINWLNIYLQSVIVYLYLSDCTIDWSVICLIAVLIDWSIDQMMMINRWSARLIDQSIAWFINQLLDDWLVDLFWLLDCYSFDWFYWLINRVTDGLLDIDQSIDQLIAWWLIG